MKGRNGKILLHQMWTQTAGVPDYIRNELKKKNQARHTAE